MSQILSPHVPLCSTYRKRGRFCYCPNNEDLSATFREVVGVLLWWLAVGRWHGFIFSFKSYRQALLDIKLRLLVSDFLRVFPFISSNHQWHPRYAWHNITISKMHAFNQTLRNLPLFLFGVFCPHSQLCNIFWYIFISQPHLQNVVSSYTIQAMYVLLYCIHV